MSIYKYVEPLDVNNLIMIDYLQKNEFFIAFGKTSAWDTSWGEDVSEENPPLPNNNLNDIPNPFIFKRCKFVNPIVETSCNSSGFSFNTCNIFEAQDIEWVELDYTDTDLINLVPFKIRNYVARVELTDLEFTVDSFRAAGLYLNPTLKSGVSSNLLTYTPDQLENYGTLKLVSFFTPIFNNDQIVNFSLIDSI